MDTKKIEKDSEPKKGTVKLNKEENNEFGSIELRPSMKLNSGNYEILGKLGEPGGFGITYLGYNTSLKRKVAIKEYFPRSYANRDSNMTVVPTESKQDQEDFEWGYNAFIKEAQLIANLPKHDNIIDVEALFKENGTAYFAMSYEEGQDLEAYLRDNHPMTQKEIEDIIFPFLEGVKHIHKHNILHRDIKLANILIRTKDNQPVLIDFGTARNQLLQRQKKLTAVYTEGYAALEQHIQSKEGPYTDIYAIGMVIYSMMNGITDTKLLPTAIKRYEAMHTKKVSLLTFPDDGRFSKRFIDAVKKATEIEAKDRPQSVDELIELFKEEKSETDISGGKKIKKVYTISSIIAIVALLGGAYFYYNKTSQTPISQTSLTSTPTTIATSNPVKTSAPSTVTTNPKPTPTPTIKEEVSNDDIDYFNEAKLALAQGNIPKAIEYFTISANKGNPLAAFELGEIYDLRLNKRNSAIKWYEKADKLGNLKAKYPLAILYCQQGNFRKFNSDKTILEYAKNSRKEVKRDIGLCYNLMGNINESKKWFESAVKMGSNKAKELLYEVLTKEFGYTDKKAREHIDKLSKE